MIKGKNQEYFIYLREKKNLPDRAIGELFSITRERVRQIRKDIKHYRPVEELKTATLRKRESLGIFGEVKIKGGGRDFIREVVRMRDKHTCQVCKRRWNEGQRRFDIHHLNGFCGKKSRSVDKISEIDGLITLCHKCHFNRPEHKSKMKKLTR